MKTLPAAYYEGSLDGGEDILASQAWFDQLIPGRPEGERFISTTVHNVDLHLPIGGLVDSDKERQRLEKEEEKVASDLAKLSQRLSNPDFVERAKPEVIERDRLLKIELESRLAKIQDRKMLFSEPG